MTNSILCLSCAALLLVHADQVAAGGSPPAPPAAPSLSVDCEARRLPSQREVGEMLGQDNPYQVYASRVRLMTEVARACKRKGVAKVLLVPAHPAADQVVDRSVARQRAQ